MAVGLIAEKQKNTKVFVVLSDGELQEGSTWEAIMLIPAKAKNVIMIMIIIIYKVLKNFKTHPNLYQLKKIVQFGWSAQRCMDTTQNKFLIKFILEIKKPFALIAETIKGILFPI